MTFPAGADYFRKGLLANLTTPATGSQDRADWDTDALKLYLFTDAFSTTFSTTYGASFSTDTEVGYNSGTGTSVGNICAGNAEATGGGAGGWPMGTVNVQIVSGKILWTVSAPTLISGITTSFHGGFLCDSVSTTKWALALYNFGTDWNLSSANTITINWPTSPVSRTLFYIG